MKLESISGIIIEHLKDKTYELEVNTTNRNFSEFYQDINESKKGYKHQMNSQRLK
jgi:predicted RNA-binding protein associated with RNAse of E/G family